MKFQDDISNMNTHTQTSRNQYVPHFFKVGGIKTLLVLRNTSETLQNVTNIVRCQKNGDFGCFGLYGNLKVPLIYNGLTGN